MLALVHNMACSSYWLHDNESPYEIGEYVTTVEGAGEFLSPRQSATAIIHIPARFMAQVSNYLRTNLLKKTSAQLGLGYNSCKQEEEKGIVWVSRSIGLYNPLLEFGLGMGMRFGV